MTRDQAKSFLEENQVKFVLAQFVDIHGVAKTKSVPVSHFEDILNDGAGFAGFAVWGLGQEPHDPDFMAVGDLSTLSLIPWQPGYARVVCNGRVRGQPYRYDTRYILEQQINRLSERGWTLNTGLEPEFMLLVKNPDGSLRPADDSDTLDKISLATTTRDSRAAGVSWKNSWVLFKPRASTFIRLITRTPMGSLRSTSPIRRR